MSAEFASPVAELGASVMRHLRNATAVFNDDGASVDCVFLDRPQVSAIGEPGMAARRIELRCLEADVSDIGAEASVVVSHPGAAAPWYLVKHREPDNRHTGWVTFHVEPAQ